MKTNQLCKWAITGALVMAFTTAQAWSPRPYLDRDGYRLLSYEVLKNEPAQPEQPQFVVQVVCGMLVVGVGAVVVYGLWKLCKKIPPVEPAPETNDPPVVPVIPTNAPPPTNPPPKKHWWTFVSDEQAPGALYTDISASGMMDRNGAQPVPYVALVTAGVESSTDLTNWQTAFTFTAWVSPMGAAMVFYQGGAPVLTNYTPAVMGSFTNYVPLDIGSGDEPRKFFRIAK